MDLAFEEGFIIKRKINIKKFFTNSGVKSTDDPAFRFVGSNITHYILKYFYYKIYVLVYHFKNSCFKFAEYI